MSRPRTASDCNGRADVGLRMYLCAREPRERRESLGAGCVYNSGQKGTVSSKIVWLRACVHTHVCMFLGMCIVQVYVDLHVF